MNIGDAPIRHHSDAGLARSNPDAANPPPETNPSHAQQHALLNDLSARSPSPGAHTGTAFRAPPPPPSSLAGGSAVPPPPPPPGLAGTRPAFAAASNAASGAASSAPSAATAQAPHQAQPADVSAHARPHINLASATPVRNDTKWPFDNVFEHEGRHYVRLEPPGGAHEVTQAGTNLHLHTDGQPLGPRLRHSGDHWAQDLSHSTTPASTYSSRTNSAGNLKPMDNAPKFYSNVNEAPLPALDVSQHVNVDQVKTAIQSRFGQHGADLNGVELVPSSCQDIAQKCRVPFDASNIKANPSAWTSPEGKIHIAADHPDYAQGGQPDQDKIRSTVVHEFIHAASKNHTGLQNRTSQLGGPVNYDEALVDHLAHEVYGDLYPGRPYKSAYFSQSRTFWHGNLGNFMADQGIMSKEDIRDAMFRNPDQFRPLPPQAQTEWKRWDNH